MVLLLAVGSGWGLARLGVPAPWLLGPLATTVAMRLLRGEPKAVPVAFLVASQAVLGLATGLSSRPDALGMLGHGLWALALVLVVTTGTSILGGFLLARWAGLDPGSGFLGSMPGAASGIVAMSTELGTDPRIVATLQYLRVVVVAATGPLLASLLERAVLATRPDTLPGALLAAGAAGAPAGSGVAAAAPVVPAAHFPALAAGAAVAAFAAWRVGLPAPNFLGPLILGLALRWSGVVGGGLPGWVQSLGLAVMAVTVGARFDRRTFAILGRAAVIDLGIIAGLIAASSLAAYVFHLATGVDIVTAFLGALPGSMDTITATAADLGADGAVVAAMHLTRFLLIALTGPWLARWLGEHWAGESGQEHARTPSCR